MYEFVLAFNRYVWGVIWRTRFFSFARIYFYITCIITKKKLKPEETLACENMRFSSLFNVPIDEERGDTDVFAG